MNEFDAVISECKKALSSDHNIDEALQILRENGYSKIESIKILVENLGIPFGSAKAMVHNSAIWNDVKARDDEFHNQALDLLEKDSDSND